MTNTFELDPAKRLRKSNYINFLNMKPYLTEEGRVQVELKVNEDVLNLNKTLHGGVHASLLDTVIGQTISQETKSSVATISLNVFYTAPAQNESTLTAKANIVQKGRSVATGEGTITDEEGTLIAKAIGSFRILRKRGE